MADAHVTIEIDGLSKLQAITKAMISDYENSWNNEMMRRAVGAYYRQGGTRMPCKFRSRIAKHRGKHYAYLADEMGTLAVYRIASESSFKRKAKVWPKAIEAAPMFRQAMLIYNTRRHATLSPHAL